LLIFNSSVILLPIANTSFSPGTPPMKLTATI
jgi:hypothetical protein